MFVAMSFTLLYLVIHNDIHSGNSGSHTREALTSTHEYMIFYNTMSHHVPYTEVLFCLSQISMSNTLM